MFLYTPILSVFIGALVAILFSFYILIFFNKKFFYSFEGVAPCIWLFICHSRCHRHNARSQHYHFGRRCHCHYFPCHVPPYPDPVVLSLCFFHYCPRIQNLVRCLHTLPATTCSKLTTKTKTRFEICCIYCQLWTYFTPCSSVFIGWYLYVILHRNDFWRQYYRL